MDAPDKLTVKVTFSNKDPMDAEVIPVLRKQKKRAAFLRTAAFCYVRGIPSRRDSPSPQQTTAAVHAPEATSQPQHPEKDPGLDAKVSMLEKLDF